MIDGENASICHFSEYQMFFESAERVTDRRINLNRTNYTICVAIITGIGVSGGWALEKNNANLNAIIFTIIALVSISSIILCIGWLRQITDLKILNNAKFRVIGEMERQLLSLDGGQNLIASFRPFAKEWEIVEKQNGITELFGIRVLRGSKVEYVLPSTIIVLFAAILIFSFIQIAIYFL